MAKETGNLTDIEFTYGLPPTTETTAPIIHNTMPQATITPCVPKFEQGHSLFRLEEEPPSYLKLLEDHGFTKKSGDIQVAFLADSFPTDTFTNEFGETFLDRFAKVASGGVSDVMQILGTRSAGETADVMQEIAGEGKFADLIGWVQGKAGAAETALTKKAGEIKGSRAKQVAQNILNVTKAVATGGRFDFPQVWKNSTFSPSYTMTIRLWNPSPGNAESTRKFIVGPIASLLLLTLPQSDKDVGSAYKWPYLCKVRAPGIFHLSAAYVSSVAVIKGGDQQSIAWNQNLGVVDVRIDFGSLFNSVLTETTGSVLKDSRPTLRNYLEGIGGPGLPNRQGKGLYNPFIATQESLFGEEGIRKSLEEILWESREYNHGKAIPTKTNQKTVNSVNTQNKQTETASDPTSTRVTQEQKDAENNFVWP